MSGVYGCNGCLTTGGPMACPHHGQIAQEAIMSGSIELDGAAYSEMRAMSDPTCNTAYCQCAAKDVLISDLRRQLTEEQAATAELLSSLDGLNEQYDAALDACLEQQERIRQLKGQLADAQEVVASATDIANSWARESGVDEALNEKTLARLIDRLWSRLSSDAQRQRERLTEAQEVSSGVVETLERQIAKRDGRIAELSQPGTAGRTLAVAYELAAEYGMDGASSEPPLAYIARVMGEQRTRIAALDKPQTPPHWMGPAEYAARLEAGDLPPEGTYYTGERKPQEDDRAD